MMMSFSFHRMGREDFKILSDWESKIPEFKVRFDEEAINARVGDKAFFGLLAYSETGAPAGYMLCYDRYGDGSLYCWTSAVLPDCRGQGLYGEMAKKREAFAKEQGYDCLKIKTRNKFRAMLSFLVKDGWQFTDVKEADQTVDHAIYATKPLSE